MRSPVLAAIAAVSLVTSSSAAIAQTAAPTAPVAPVARSGASVDDASQLRGTTLWIVGIIALLLLIWGLIELLNNGNDAPVSP